MKTDNKHYKCINSQTGNAIFYHSVDGKMSEDEIKTELERVKAQAAVQNALPVNIIYCEEIKQDN